MNPHDVDEQSTISQREVGSDTKSFKNALKHVLRQDPDVVVIGEMREFEAIAAGITAAETGHLVLSTIHTNDAPSTINRLLNMGVEPFLITAAVNGVVSQRLIRKLCDDCKEEEPVDRSALEGGCHWRRA